MTQLEIINEALGEFSNQYNLAKEIAEKTVSMIKSHHRNGVFNTQTDCQLKKYIEKNAMLYYHEHIKLGKTDWFIK